MSWRTLMLPPVSRVQGTTSVMAISTCAFIVQVYVSVPAINHAVLSAERRQFFSSVSAWRMRPARSIGTHFVLPSYQEDETLLRETLENLAVLFRQRNTYVLC